MRKRIEPTIVEQAIESVAGFDQVFKKLEQQVVHLKSFLLAVVLLVSDPESNSFDIGFC